MQRLNDRLYSWASDVEEDTIAQAQRTADLPIVEGHVALMPDAHVGIGATVGSVIATNDAIIPSAVGVDIGCGMIASSLWMTASQLPDDLTPLLSQVERTIPAGVGKGHSKGNPHGEVWVAANPGHSEFSEKREATAVEQFGSLGSGNHFFELCLDESDNVWVVLHSGSRGIGNQLASEHIKKAKVLNTDLLADPDLAYFVYGQPEFKDYIYDMRWAQDYAFANRQRMMSDVLRQIAYFVFGDFEHNIVNETINCHHNFTQPETHNGKKVWVTRKGAIKADVDDMGVIPGSMGTRSYIVKGKGNPDSFNSCSHGAGRRMSRGQAKRTFTEADLTKAMEGKTWQAKDASQLIDEIPASYKDIDQVMEDQKDLVEVQHVLHQVLNYKGTK